MEGPREVLERILSEGFATGNDAIVDELCAPDLIEHQFGLAGRGDQAREQVKAAIRQVHELMPDIVYTLEDSVVVGDLVWAAAGRAGPPPARSSAHRATRRSTSRCSSRRASWTAGSSSTGALRTGSRCWRRRAR